MKILINFAHPAYQKSIIHKAIIEKIQTIENITINDLYEEYPKFNVDVKKEQKLLADHDCIILQFPLYWYAAPSLIKEWMDHVFEYNWAFGEKGNMLKDKYLFIITSMGGNEFIYSGNCQEHFSLDQLFTPYQQSAKKCDMNWLPPYPIFDANSISENELNIHTNNIAELIDNISNDKCDLNKLKNLIYLKKTNNNGRDK